MADTSWPMLHHDSQHTGRSPYTGPKAPSLKWSYSTGTYIYYDSSPTIGADGTIYVGSLDGKLYAIGAAGGFSIAAAVGFVVIIGIIVFLVRRRRLLRR